jgi:hypothetical protein
VVPLQSLGVIDVDASSVSDSDVLAHALANVSVEEKSRSFAVKRSSSFVNEYGRCDKDGNPVDGGIEDPNHLMAAFPVLFPYGKGGLEVDRKRKVPYESHVRWALQYADRRFRKDLSFIFQVFGVIQKRQMCFSASLQIRRASFHRHREIIHNVTPADLVKASAEELRRVPYTNPGVRALRQHVSAVRAKVMGTDESRTGIRSQIWGMTMMCGPPSLWITINPSDTNDPIAQVMAGVDINLDNFEKTAGPDGKTRARTIAADPFAAAKFFHYMINAIIETLFGFKKKRHNIFRTNGILGMVQGYIGTVEAQGRGTLHLHVLIWLVGALTAAKMRNALKSEDFRQKVIKYIDACIRADIDNRDTSAVLSIKKESAVAYSRPPNPKSANFAEIARESEKALVRTVQVHTCSKEGCIVIKNGRLQCKRRAPFPVAKATWVNEDGSWGVKRTYGYLNNWNPTILLGVRSNHDIKLITNGVETKDITWYITQYATKKQYRSCNTSALLAKRLAFHKIQEKYTSDCQLLNKRLLSRSANTLSREQEFGAPEVMSYLMGWGDRYISHNFATIYWDGVTGSLKRKFPELRMTK